ncbi:histidine phosphatase family protein [Roseomonas haemaphysalidis]|uniref:histidine phosphatase family protein n=1 Tax=Roseomonas haemaphysalidis TaxID=2768162 RepID=UPI001F2D6176|nr:histidine phosphatase family protein [Roseomonas haemaphysalidis]
MLHFITHPEVMIDPLVPVPRWGLAPLGIARMRALAALPEMAAVQSVWASTEAKAIEGAGILAGRLGLPVQVHAGLGENDRDATGYLPEAEFQRTADAFFASPDQSIRGWERAVDAQARIVGAIGAVLAAAPPGPVAVVAHGGVGALLRAHLAGAPISRSWDQPGAGCRFVMRPGQKPGDWVALPAG